MAILTDDDVEKLFSGAPQFCARNEGPFISIPVPIVAFPFDEDLQIRDLTDHVPIESRAWSGVTTRPHLTRDNNDARAKKQAEYKKKSNFYVKCSEKPNTLSLQGLEKGTMGYQAALELNVSDSLEEEQFGFDSIGKKAKAIIDARDQMLSNDGWLHRISEPELLNRLQRNGEIHRNNDLKSRVTLDTYNELFSNFMRPRYVAIDKNDNHSLTNQVVALLKCLGSPNVWIDLSHVEWRIRLGQILWGEQYGDKLSDETHIHDIDSEKERAEEKYWLLLQILVATELLIRLDAITEGEEYGGGAFRPIDIVQFERAANPTVKWSLLLARSWLENVEVAREEEEKIEDVPVPVAEGAPTTEHHSAHKKGWLASLFSKISPHHHHVKDERPPSPPYHYVIRGRNGQRQVDGLIHFARKLRWPGIDAYQARISEHAQAALEPKRALEPVVEDTKPADAGSYFGTWDVTCQRGHHKERSQARRRKVAAALNASGWLSKSYVFGLVLPGDGMSHFLMATLLENDTAALSKIGCFANLCGGFVYSGMSFWSTSCILGRVLAAGNGTAECMGWISTDITPVGMEAGWVNIEVEDVKEDVARLGKKSRIWAKKKIERQSFIVGTSLDDAAAAEDFVIPHENSYAEMPPGVLIELLSLQLAPAAQSLHPTPLAEIIPTPTLEHFPDAPDLPSHPATLNFTVLIDGQTERTHKISLYYDVNFVTAHPCAPSHRVRFMKSPSSPTIREVDASGTNTLGSGSRSVYRAGHPLHKTYHYKVIHISELIQKKHSSLSDLLTPDSIARAPETMVLVIDCMTSMAGVPQSAILQRLQTPSSSPVAERKPSFSAFAKMHTESRERQFGSDMEILVRALCAEKGWNAIISRRRRGCLACAIREAGALAWKVVVRVD